MEEWEWEMKMQRSVKMEWRTVEMGCKKEEEQVRRVERR